jgi:hypothetical protein
MGAWLKGSDTDGQSQGALKNVLTAKNKAAQNLF